MTRASSLLIREQGKHLADNGGGLLVDEQMSLAVGVLLIAVKGERADMIPVPAAARKDAADVVRHIFEVPLVDQTVDLARFFVALVRGVGAEISVSGQMNLLFYPEYKLGGARRVMDILERRELLTELLAGKQNRTQIKIGTETGQNALAESSVICSRYSVNGRDAGAVAVIGPMRMQYAHVAAQTAYVADRVGEMLTRIMREE